jgi:hypothetical protein
MARPIDSIRSGAALGIAALVAIACGRAQPRAPSPVIDRCSLVASTAAVDSASVVVVSPVDARNAQRPTTWGERFVFGLTDTVPRLDCAGRSLTAAGPYSVRDAGRSTLVLEPVAGARGPRLTVRPTSEADARDLVDAGVDLLLTESPSLAAYASTKTDVVSVALPWDRTWVLVTPRQAVSVADSAFRGDPRDVVRAEARVARGPFWWTDAGVCPAPMIRVVPAARPTLRIAYSRDEPVGRALAERLVALAGNGITTVAITPNAFDAAVRTGSELGYVMSLPRLVVDRCRAISALLTEVPWLAGSSAPQAAITPLIDTRLHAVVKRDRLNLAMMRDSTVTISVGSPATGSRP